MAALVAARITALSPGASPPPVAMPIQRMSDMGIRRWSLVVSLSIITFHYGRRATLLLGGGRKAEMRVPHFSRFGREVGSSEVTRRALLDSYSKVSLEIIIQTVAGICSENSDDGLGGDAQPASVNSRRIPGRNRDSSIARGPLHSGTDVNRARDSRHVRCRLSHRGITLYYAGGGQRDHTIRSIFDADVGRGGCANSLIFRSDGGRSRAEVVPAQDSRAVNANCATAARPGNFAADIARRR